MRSNICSFFRSGHCKFKLSCSKSHDILTCRFGPSCPFIKSCNFRHPPLCENFLKNKCGFFQNGLFRASKSCSHFHFPSHYPPPPLVPHLQHPHHPPYIPNIPGPIIPGHHDTSSRVEHLEIQVWKLTTELAAVISIHVI